MIYLIRHGLDDENFVGGWSDRGLIEEGKKQIEDAIEYLKKNKININKIITSDITRAYQTAEMISQALNIRLEKTSILRELDKGKFTGIKKTQIEKDYPNFLDNVEIDTIYPEGESQMTFNLRVQRNINEILKEDNVLLVTHRGVINEIYRYFNNDEISTDKKRYGVDHGSIHEFNLKTKNIKKIYLGGTKMIDIAKKIVLTGGPCAGKTTALAKIEKDLTEQGYKVLIVSESATELIKGGIRPFGEKAFDNITFQNLILDYQLAKERIYETAANSSEEKCIIIYDRGVMDNKAYINHKQFNKLLQDKNLSELDLLDNYDMVIHLVTAADGKAQYYTLANNEARSESIEEAIELDKRTVNAWLGHNNLKIIDNNSEFDEKISKVLSEINNLLSPTKRIRQQKKYIVDIKTSDLDFLNDETSTRIDITQTYIEDSKDIYERRIREKRNGQDITHFMTVQKKQEKGISTILLDKKITSKEYETLLSSSENNRTINKTRISFVYQKNVYRLDIFEDGLSILELDIATDNLDVKLPDYIQIIEDVTDKEAFRNYALANSDNKVLNLLI